MKKLIYIASFLFTSFMFAQGGPKVDVIKFRGEVTTTVRNTFDVPTGERWLIWNVTTSQFEHAGSDDVWTSLVSGTGDVTGPASSTDNAIARFDSTTGKIIQNSTTTLEDTGVITMGGNLAMAGNTIEMNFGSITDATSITSDYFPRVPTDILELSPDVEPTGSEGDVYADDASNRPKYNDGTSWKAFILEGDAAGTDDQTASEVPFTPNGSIAATNVQAAIQEVRDEAGSGVNLADNNTWTGFNIFNGIRLDNASAGPGIFYSKLSNGTTNLAPPSGYGSLYFTNNEEFKVTTNNGTDTPDLGFNFSAITATKNLVFEDNDVLWGLESLKNTDTQQLTLSGTTLTLEDGGTPIDLNPTFATQAELDAAVISGGGLTTDQNNRLQNVNNVEPLFITTSTYTTTIANQEVQSGAKIGSKVLNIVNDATTSTVALTNTSATKMEFYHFDVDSGTGQLTFTSANGFVGTGFTGNSVRITGIGECSFRETGYNTGVWRIYPGEGVTFITIDQTAPTVVSATVNDGDPDAVVITYSEALDTGNVPATTQYTINDPSANAVTSVNISGSTVTLDLTNPIENGSTVTLGYSSSGTALRDLAGNLAGSVSSVSVTNNVAGCTPLVNNVATQSNAASDPNCNESNNTTGWINQGTTITSQTGAEAQNGNYYLRGVAFNGSSNRMEYIFPVTSGDTYTVKFKARQSVGTSSRLTSWGLLTGGPGYVSIPSTWTEFTYNVTASSTGTAIIRVYSAEGAGGAAGDTIFVDNFSVVKTN